jgi:hypothetical protein
MANRYWVGGTGAWDASNTTHWSATTGGAGGASVPTSIDSVFINASSGSSPTITVTATANCLDLDFTGAITPTFAGSSALNIYGSLIFISTINRTYTGQINFMSTTLGKTLTTAGISFDGITYFSGVGGGWTLQSGFTTTAPIFLTDGTLNTNGMAVSCDIFNCSGTTTRTLTLGSSTITCSTFGSSAWYATTVTNLTFSAGTSTIILTNFAGFDGGGLTYYNITATGSNSMMVTGSNTFNTLTIAAGKKVTLAAGTITTIANIVSNGIAGNLAILSSDTAASAATISTSAAISASHLTVQDITKAGTGSITFRSSLPVSGNTGINFYDRYWINGTGNVSDTTHWAYVSGGSGSAGIPTSNDNIYFDSASFNGAGQTVTVNATFNCLNMDWTGVVNTPTMAGNTAMNIYGSLTLVSGMTITYNATFNFKATSSGRTITTAGKTLSSLTFNGVGGGWILQDALTTTGNITLTAGTLNTNNKNVSCVIFSTSGSTTRALTLGTSTFTCSQQWTISSKTGLTFNTNTSTIVMTGNNLQTFTGGALSYNNLTLQGSVLTIDNSNTFTTLTLSQGMTLNITSGTTQTVTTLIGDGISPTNFIRLQSTTSGSAFTISTPSAITKDYYWIKDCTKAGTGSITLTHGYNISGNTGITFTNTIAYTGGTNRYWVGDSGTWGANATHWSDISGATGGASAPDATNSVFFDANSFTTTGQTVTMNASGIFCLDIDWTGATNTPTWGGNTTVFNIGGSLTLIPNMNITFTFSSNITFNSTTTGRTITTAGKQFPYYITFNGTGGGWTLQDNLDLGGKDITLTAGTLNTNNKNVSCGTFNSSNSNTRSLTLGSSTITCSSAWTFTTTTGLTFNKGTSTIIMNGVTQTFNGGGITYYNVSLTGTPIIIAGSNSFNTLTLTAAKTVRVTAGTTQTIAKLVALGTSGNIITIQSVTASSSFTFSIASGTIAVNYCSIQDSIASGGATFNAYNSTNVSGNTGWNFPAGNPPVGYQHKITGQLIIQMCGVAPIKVNGV